MSEFHNSADLAKEYGAPFAIISHEEGSRYTSLISRDYTSPRSLDLRNLLADDDTNAVDAYFRTLSFEKIVKMKHHAYHHLMLQFYTTLNFIADDHRAGFHCRLMGKSVTLTRRTLCDIFGLRDGGLEAAPQNFDPVGFWKEISDGRVDFKGSRTPCALIKDPILLLMHRYISHVVFGRGDSSRVGRKDLFYLWCLRRGVHVATPCFLLATFKSIATKKRPNMCLGNFITAIALHFGTFDPLQTNMTVLRARPLGLTTTAAKEGKCCKGAEKEEGKSNCEAAKGGGPSAKRYKATSKEEAPYYKSVANIDDQAAGPSTTPPAVDTWIMLVSREMEKMQAAWMNDGLKDLKAGFDGLEKKFNAMCASFQTFQRDLRPGESDGTKDVDKMNRGNFDMGSDKAAGIYEAMLDNLSTRMEKIEEGLAKISNMKVLDLANLARTFEEGENSEFPDSRGKNGRFGKGSTPDADADIAELLACNSIGSSKGLSKNGGRKSPQQWQDDIVRNSPNCSQPAAGHNLPRPGSNVCSASRDHIIEILDSDDETKPKGAVETSKRDLESNEMNLVQGSYYKRKRTQSMRNVFASSTTNKWKKAVHTVEVDDEDDSV